MTAAAQAFAESLGLTPAQSFGLKVAYHLLMAQRWPHRAYHYAEVAVNYARAAAEAAFQQDPSLRSER